MCRKHFYSVGRDNRNLFRFSNWISCRKYPQWGGMGTWKASRLFWLLCAVRRWAIVMRNIFFLYREDSNTHWDPAFFFGAVPMSGINFICNFIQLNTRRAAWIEKTFAWTKRDAIFVPIDFNEIIRWNQPTHKSNGSKVRTSNSIWWDSIATSSLIPDGW